MIYTIIKYSILTCLEVMKYLSPHPSIFFSKIKLQWIRFSSFIHSIIHWTKNEWIHINKLVSVSYFIPTQTSICNSYLPFLIISNLRTKITCYSALNSLLPFKRWKLHKHVVNEYMSEWVDGLMDEWIRQ